MHAERVPGHTAFCENERRHCSTRNKIVLAFPGMPRASFYEAKYRVHKCGCACALLDISGHSGIFSWASVSLSVPSILHPERSGYSTGETFSRSLPRRRHVVVTYITGQGRTWQQSIHWEWRFSSWWWLAGWLPAWLGECQNQPTNHLGATVGKEKLPTNSLGRVVKWMSGSVGGGGAGVDYGRLPAKLQPEPDLETCYVANYATNKIDLWSSFSPSSLYVTPIYRLIRTNWIYCC